MVGGRAYFEANLFGYQTSSFTTKGFFDQLGYEEPMKPYIFPDDPNRFLKLLQQALPLILALVAIKIVRSAVNRLLREKEGPAVVPGEKLHKD